MTAAPLLSGFEKQADYEAALLLSDAGYSTQAIAAYFAA